MSNDPTKMFLDEVGSDPAWNYSTSKLPEDKELIATISNGFLGTRMFSDTVYAAGVFNGNHLTSHRARIPSTLPTNIKITLGCSENIIIAEESLERKFTLDVQNGVFLQSITSIDKTFLIMQKTYAHKYYQNLLVTEIKAKTIEQHGIYIILESCKGKESTDINFSSECLKDFSIMHGETNETEGADVEKIDVAAVYSPPQGNMKIKVEKTNDWQSFNFITAISSSLETSNPRSKAIQEFNMAINALRENPADFWDKHQSAWQMLWKSGHITIDGNSKLSQAINSSLYYIISSLRPSWPYGLSPCGLPSDGYLGHTFWDQATWMFPPLLLFHQDLAKSCLEYRYNRINAARKRATQNGYKGTMFPWESAFSGEEVCPEPDPYSKFEHHIVGDVGFAVQQYWMATHDNDWFEKCGKYLIEGVAEFWSSRVTYDSTKNLYVINHVQGPDEYHYNVNNSVYTNMIAKINLEFAVDISKKFKLHVPSSWSHIAANMYIPFDIANNYHPEFDGYQLKTTVKQADVILLGYPLMHDMKKDVRRNDLEFYEACTDPNGPAMTKAMFAIGWLELKEFSQAASSFEEGYSNITEPFKVWTETPHGGEVNFITGAGGFLQSLLFGYGGIRLKNDGLHINPKLPDKAQRLCFRGITYLGNKLDYVFDTNNVTVCVTEQFVKNEKLSLIIGGSKEEMELYLGVARCYSCGDAIIRSLSHSIEV